MQWQWRHGKSITYLYIPEWENEGIQIAFTTREGGFSQPPYHSLNLGLHVGDNPEHVISNRRQCLAEWQADEQQCVIGEQVHGIRAVWVDSNDGGRGFSELTTAVPQVDALLTTQSGLGLMAFYADCIPIFFYHPEIKAVAIAHAGWKGTVGKIALEVLKSFRQAGGEPNACWAAIGPGIGPCCYEVDEPVAERFREAGLPCFTPGRAGHYFLNLEEANYQILLSQGLNPEKIVRAGLCTACTPQFFSHRRDEGLTGRMAGWIRMSYLSHQSKVK